MGTAESKAAPSTRGSAPHHAFIDDDQTGVLRSSFAAMAHASPSLTEAAFVEFFASPRTSLSRELLTRLFNRIYNLTSAVFPPSRAGHGVGIAYEQYNMAMKQVLKGDRIDFYLSIFGNGNSPIDQSTLEHILLWDYETWIDGAGIKEDDPDRLAKERATILRVAAQTYHDLSRQATQGGSLVVDDVKRWAFSVGVNLGDGVVSALQRGMHVPAPLPVPLSFFTSTLLPTRVEAYWLYLILPHSTKKERLPQLAPAGQVKYLPSSSSSQWCDWDCLFSTDKHGWSISRFCTKVLDYKAHTVLLVLEKGGGIFGAFVSEEWKLSRSSAPRFQTAPGTQLFQISPLLQVFPAQGPSSNHVLLTCDSMAGQGMAGVAAAGVSAGTLREECIALGGQIGHYRLKIEEGLGRGECRPADTSYKHGSLLRRSIDEPIEDFSRASEAVFDIMGVECWGGGGADAQQRQQSKNQRDLDLVMKMRKVNIAKMFGAGVHNSDSLAPDMAILDMAGVHQSHVKDADHV